MRNFFLANKVLSVPKISGYIKFNKSITEISEVERETRRRKNLSECCENIKGSMSVEEVKIDIDEVTGSGRSGKYLSEYFIGIMNLFPKKLSRVKRIA